MSGGGGGVIIIRQKLRAAAQTETLQEQLGPIKRTKLQAIIAKIDDDWSGPETRFVARCILDAVEAYEE